MSDTPRKASFQDLLTAKAPVTVRDLFGVPPELNQALIDARDLVRRLNLRDTEDEATRLQLAEAEAQLQQARDAVRDAGIEVVMQSIGRDAWEKLKKKHPPTDQQRAEYKARNGTGQLEYDYETFPIPAIAAACIQPEMSEEQAAQLWDSPAWNEAECARLFEMAMAANETRQVGNLAF